MSNINDLEEHCDNIDSMIFTGDITCQQKGVELLQEYINKWQRAIDGAKLHNYYQDDDLTNNDDIE